MFKNSFDLGGNRAHDLRTRSTVTLPTGLQGWTEKVGGDLGGESRRRESEDTYECCAAKHYENEEWNRELTLKCKLKYFVRPMKDPLGVSPSKGNQATTRGKGKIILTSIGGNRTHDLRIRSTVTLPTELLGRTEKVGDDLGGESRRRESKDTMAYTKRNTANI